jgi:hypothetical protein
MENTKNKNTPQFIQKIKAYFLDKNNRIKSILIVLSLTLTGVLFAQYGIYQLDKNRIKKGKKEYKNGNWRAAYRILYDNRDCLAFHFDKEACQMLGCILKTRIGGVLERGEGSGYWLQKGGSVECPKIK